MNTFSLLQSYNKKKEKKNTAAAAPCELTFAGAHSPGASTTCRNIKIHDLFHYNKYIQHIFIEEINGLRVKNYIHAGGNLRIMTT